MRRALPKIDWRIFAHVAKRGSVRAKIFPRAREEKRENSEAATQRNSGDNDDVDERGLRPVEGHLKDEDGAVPGIAAGRHHGAGGSQPDHRQR